MSSGPPAAPGMGPARRRGRVPRRIRRSLLLVAWALATTMLSAEVAAAISNLLS